jgi:hypothetical protein
MKVRLVWDSLLVGMLAGASGIISGGVASAATPPALASLTYTVPAGSGGALLYPAGVSAANGHVYVSNTGGNVIADVNAGSTNIIAGSLEGNGEAGDGGPATAATFTSPGGTVEDSHGDTFIADTEDNVIREITPDGMIHRFAGTGEEGNSGLGGPATAAELDFPQDVAVNAAGDVFFSDSYNNRVDEVLPDGTLRAVAGNGTAGYSGDGGPASSAELSFPVGVAVDALGNVYIADASNNVIRRVDSATGIITTVAGDYAADRANNDGLGGFSGDGGPANSAELNDPQGVALDGAGDLFIADTFNNAIRMVTPAGIISTVVNQAAKSGAETAGTATASKLKGPTAVAVDASTETLYIADTSNNAIGAVANLAQAGDAGGSVGSQPTTALPESPIAVGLPLVALGLAGVFLVLRRRRTAKA